MENPDPQRHKCSLFEEEIAAITYNSGGTYTLGALLEVQYLCIFKRIIIFTRRFKLTVKDSSNRMLPRF